MRQHIDEIDDVAPTAPIIIYYCTLQCILFTIATLIHVNTMHFPMLMSDAIKLYDCLVNELSEFSPNSTPDQIEKLALYHQLQCVCRILLQVHEQDNIVLSENQRNVINSSLEHLESRLSLLDTQDEMPFRDDIIQVRWDRATLTIYKEQGVSISTDEDDNQIDCWADREELEQEESMLLAMAFTPIPSESNTTLKNASTKKRSSQNVAL
ncbi:hypothetical protein MPSEU_000816600 [Mayamaea pseudoterrestris]|nr:hypothetical protein MPSEU_000816600 [Mayamaea pseudoterrestris]